MNLQRRLLRAMLWMLGMSAAAGVLAVFLSTAVMGRVAGTTLIAAVAIAFAMPMSKFLDDQKKRIGGLIGLGSIVLGFINGLCAVWIDLFVISWDVSWRLWFTAMIITVGGAMAGVLAASIPARWARWTAITALMADLVAITLLLISIWTHSDSRPAETAGFLLASGAAGSLALLGAGIERLYWRWIGVLASVAALGIGIDGTWYSNSHDPTLWIIAMCIAVVVAHAIVVLRVPMGEARFWTLLVAIGSTACAGGCVAALAAITGGFVDSSGPELLTRMAGASGIISACSTLAVVVMYRLHRRPPGAGERIADITSIQMTCPHCGKRHLAKIGESACATCGLLITVAVQEPRCINCDYPLLDLRGDVCPECGVRRTVDIRA